MAKKLSQKARMEIKANFVTAAIAGLVLLCVMITGVVVVYVRAHADTAEHIVWQSAYARYYGGDGETALEILERDYDVTIDHQAGFGPIVSSIEGNTADEGFEWGIWLNDERITDRPADQIETQDHDVIYWQIIKTD